MNITRKSPRSVLRVAVATLALTTVGAAAAGTSAHAYPPVPTPPPGETVPPGVTVPPGETVPPGVTVPPGETVPPPDENVSPPTTDTESGVVDGLPVPGAPSAPAQGSLPATGSSGVSTTLIAGGLALLLGVGITSRSAVSDRRRSSAADSLG